MNPNKHSAKFYLLQIVLCLYIFANLVAMAGIYFFMYAETNCDNPLAGAPVQKEWSPGSVLLFFSPSILSICTAIYVLSKKPSRTRGKAALAMLLIGLSIGVGVAIFFASYFSLFDLMGC